MKNLEAAIEALLFIYGESLTLKHLGEILDLNQEVVRAGMDKLELALKADERGLILIRQGEKAQLATKPDFSGYLEKIMKAELRESLTPAATETLSIITYGAPITRSEIDYIRGVNSSFIIRSLLLRGLVDRNLDEKRTNTYVYQASLDFLKFLGVSKVEELPDYQKFFELAKKVKPVQAAPITNPNPV